MTGFLTISDYILSIIFIIIILFIASRYQKSKQDEFEHYKYFTKGLIVKIFGGLGLAFIYVYYYQGGDTVYYFWGTEVIYKMMFKNFDVFLRLLFGEYSPELYSYFDADTGYPTYYRDPNAWAVCRFTLPFYILGLKSYLATTVIIASVMYIGIWQFYEFIVQNYAVDKKHFAWAMFYVPSVALWSSGIMKDTFTFTSILLFFTVFHRIVFKRHNILKNIIILIIWSFIMLSIRAYLFYITLACSLLWVGFGYVKQIKVVVLRFVTFPIIIILLFVFGSWLISNVSESIGGRYSVDNLLEQAWIIQDDLSREAYGENSFDIGDFEPTIPGILSKAPVAIIAGMFRPFLWEANNILMVFSGLENMLMLLLTLYILISSGIFKSINIIFSEPFVLTCLVFALIFAFMVGLTTANFGALVRYKVPIVPLLSTVLLILRSKVLNLKNE